MKPYKALVVPILSLLFLIQPIISLHAQTNAVLKKTHRAAQPQKPVGQLWTEIMAKRDAMAQTIAAKKLEPEVENLAQEIVGLANQLRDQSNHLETDKLVQLDKSVKEIQKLSAELDNLADANNQSGVEAGAKKLDEHLKSIAALYPKGTLPEKTTSK